MLKSSVCSWAPLEFNSDSGSAGPARPYPGLGCCHMHSWPRVSSVLCACPKYLVKLSVPHGMEEVVTVYVKKALTVKRN